MTQMTGGRLARLFFILLLDGLLGLWLVGPGVLVGGAALGVFIAWLLGGSLFRGAWIFALVAALGIAVGALRSTLTLLRNFRGPGAYLYKTRWGTDLTK